MNKAFSLKVVGFAARSLILVGFAGAMLPGCFTVGDDDEECSKDSDCDDDEECRKGQCRSIDDETGGTGGTGGSSGGSGGTGGSLGPGSGGTGGSGSPGVGTCSQYCNLGQSCGATATLQECLDSCDLLLGVGGTCEAATQALLNCAASFPTCDGLVENCSELAEALSTACGGGTEECPWTNDGYCDEPDLCPPGTDTADCGSGQ